jgi:hypothetical protein
MQFEFPTPSEVPACRATRDDNDTIMVLDQIRDRIIADWKGAPLTIGVDVPTHLQERVRNHLHAAGWKVTFGWPLGAVLHNSGTCVWAADDRQILP